MATRPTASGAGHSTPRDPIRVVPLRDEARLAPAPAAAPSLTYRGGPLLAAVQIFSFFWGDGWQGQPQAGLMAQIVAFFDYVVASPLLDQMAEYGVAGTAIGHGANLGAIAVPGALAASVDDSAFQQLIQQQISTNSAVPKPTPSSLYFVFAPPGVAVTLSGHAVSGLHRLHRLAHSSRRADVDDIARAVRSHHRPDSGPGLV